MNKYLLIFTLITSAIVAMSNKQGKDDAESNKKKLPVLVGVSYSMRVHPDDKERIDKAFAEQLEMIKAHQKAQVAKNDVLKNQPGNS